MIMYSSIGSDRNIPPLAYVPLVVISAGVGRKPQIIVITIATFLIMTITIYQGVINIDETGSMIFRTGRYHAIKIAVGKDRIKPKTKPALTDIRLLWMSFQKAPLSIIVLAD